MEEAINEFLQEGDRIVIYFLNAAPFKGSFVKCCHGCLVANNKMGRLTILRVEDISRVQKTESEIEMSASETEETTTREASNADVYEIEQPPLQNLKIVGKVNLDEIEPRRRERIRRVPAQAHDDYAIDENLPEDTGVKTPAMGTISAIGPKFGFIEVGGQTLYFNIGEVMKGWHNEPSLEKGDEVVFTSSENARGTVAKCVHHPWSIDRQLHVIDSISYRDMRNAKLLANQLLEAFPNDDNVRDQLYTLRML